MLTVHLRAKDGATADIQVPMPVVGMQRPDAVTLNGVTWPTVRYEDLYRTGDTISGAIGRLTKQAVITFPTGRFYADDFATGYLAAINIPHGPCMGLWGSGPGDYTMTKDGTYFGINPGTSKQQAATGQKHVLWTADNGGQSFGQFAVLGTQQAAGELYNGFAIYHPTGRCEVRDVLVAGWQGSANVPPGETAGFTIIDGTAHFNHQLTRLDGDGRRPDGKVTGTAPLGGQNLNGTEWRDCYGHDCLASQFGFYLSRNVKTFDCRSERNGSGSGGLSGQGFNHEKTDGIIHTRPRVDLARANGNVGAHFSHSNYDDPTWAPGRLTVIDPVTLTDGKPAALVAQSWSPYVAANTAAPVVTRAGASVSYTWAHG